MIETKFDIFMPAGGLGRRLGAISKKKPKPLIKISNREFILYVIDSLLKVNIGTLNLLISYKSNQFKKLKLPDIKTNFFIDKKRSGTFNCLYLIKHKINKHFIYSNSDEILDVELNTIIKKFNKYKPDVLQLYFLDKNGIQLNKKDVINTKKFNKKENYTEAGLKIFNKNIFKFKNKISYKKIEDFITDNKNKINIKIFIIDKKPYSIDSSSRITRTKKYLYNYIKF